MNKREIANFWFKSSDDDWKVVRSMFKTKHYVYALFFCHIAIEKFLKGMIVSKTGKNLPRSHDLLFLAERAGLELDASQRRKLSEINSFNIRARYDDYKLKFHKKAGKVYTEKYISTTNKLMKWLKKEFQ